MLLSVTAAACSFAPAGEPGSGARSTASASRSSAHDSSSASASASRSASATRSASTGRPRTSATRARPARTLAVRPTSSSRSASHTSAASQPLGPLQPADIFSAQSAWRQNVSQAPLAGNSSAAVANLASQVAGSYGGSAAFDNTAYDVHWYNASPSQATTTLSFNNCQHLNYVPAGLFGKRGQFVDVPIPANAQPSSGTDSTLTIYRPSTDQLWDFWEASRTASGWQACWGGRIDHVSRSLGFFTGGFGASASGLASEAGDVSITDIRRGYIDHAVTLGIPGAASWNKVSWPAQRSDGYLTSADAIAEGQRLRLPANVNIAALHLSPIAAMIATAAQKYGFIVTDQTGSSVAVVGEDGAPSQQVTGKNPWTTLMRGVPSYETLRGFPWSQLQLLPMSWGKHR